MTNSGTSFYTADELEALGFKSIGTNVLVSRKASFYNISEISLGNNVRIDDFCILSGKISLGSFIHISAFCGMYGAEGIIMDDFTGLSPRTTVFSASDDFSGDYLVGPMVKRSLTNVRGGTVVIDKHCQIGAGSVILPDLRIAEGVAVGAMSLVNKSLEPWGIYAGTPVRRIRPRSAKLLDLEGLAKE